MVRRWRLIGYVPILYNPTGKPCDQTLCQSHSRLSGRLRATVDYQVKRASYGSTKSRSQALPTGGIMQYVQWKKGSSGSAYDFFTDGSTTRADGSDLISVCTSSGADTRSVGVRECRWCQARVQNEHPEDTLA
jgi:hypothetical protein